MSAEIDNSFSVDFLQFLIQILCCFRRFGKNNRFFSFHLWIRCKITLEFIQLWIRFNQRPNELHGFQLRQICLQITEELRRKLLRFKFHNVLLFNQIHQFLRISIIQQIIYIHFLTDINLSGLGHFNKFLIGFNKTIQGLTKRIKTTLQAFYKDSLHKATHIVLSSKHGCILLFVFQIQQRCITSIFEILDNIDCLRKSIIRFLIKRVDDFLRASGLRKSQTLLRKIIRIILLNFTSGTANHNLTNQFVTDYLRIFPKLFHICRRAFRLFGKLRI